MERFKKGDLVEAIDYCSGASQGDRSILTMNRGGELSMKNKEGEWTCSCPDNWKLIKTTNKPMGNLAAAAKALKRNAPKTFWEAKMEIKMRVNASDEEEALELAQEELKAGLVKELNTKDIKQISAIEL
jgi:hypothetical protein